MEIYNVKKIIIHILYKIKTWATLKLQKNQSQKFKQDVWYLKRWAFCEILFGRSTKLFH